MYMAPSSVSSCVSAGAGVFPAFLGLLAALGLCGCAHSSRHLPAVTGFELPRYTGTWYEAVRYPHMFEKGLDRVSATYAIRADGVVTVRNRGRKTETGAWREITGTARPAGAPDVGEFQVTFFWPFHGAYRIVWLDAGYRRAIVTGSTMDYLWILSKDPVIPDELEVLISRAEQLGFDRNRMIRVEQGGGKD